MYSGKDKLLDIPTVKIRNIMYSNGKLQESRPIDKSWKNWENEV